MEAEKKEKRGRGRPRADKTDNQVIDSRVELEVDRVEEAHETERPPRVSMGATLKLEFGSLCADEDYHYRVFSDRDGRVEQAKQAWYEHVMDHTGNKVTRHSGPYVQYLMKIKKEYWNEDQELKQKKIVGTLQKEQKLEKDEYLPDDRHHALQKDEYDPLS